ncbi:ammonium transporter [Sphingobacterium sp. SRCM116780]|uniref:ammonium transporter n=1 Tax=Sphingobacterium sp. SRCM116780 TaxID=2907623 RepID=UPI001F4676A3|nr:ammonium transporter [Sphingobacterium sp. SRCM116780]UIR57668.1 ammonium transporter [Sphingobacterium sp. SRCM116780]
MIKKSAVPFYFMLIIVLLALFLPSLPKNNHHFVYNAADIAWMLTSTALVLIMTPGLAYFYGGMVRKKNVISTMLQSFICMAIVSVIWVVFGFSLVFGDTVGGIIGNPLTYFMFNGVIDGKPWVGAPTIPFALFAMFQLKFAIITPALITGAFAERIRFTSYILFICLFFVFIYAPLAHATWHPDGVLFKMGVLDFAGGTVVHMSAGLTALASAIYLKQGKETGHHTPARVTYVLLGTGMLWFGWFGFNAGSAFSASSLASTALSTTMTASAAAALTWIFFDALRGAKPSAMGTCIGLVVGLVAITPAAGFVTVAHSLVIGAVAAIISRLVVDWRTRSKVDDTLDVFPCHGVGGIVGMILTGVFAHKQINPAVKDNGLFYGETALFQAHMLGLFASAAYILIVSFLLLKVTDLISPLRASEEEELIGMDISQHAEKL